jgi:hypothetical protein
VIGENELDATFSLAADQLSVTYLRIVDGSLNYTFERSSNLLQWAPFIPIETTLTTGPQAQQRRATDPVSGQGIARRFLRVRVESEP